MATLLLSLLVAVGLIGLILAAALKMPLAYAAVALLANGIIVGLAVAEQRRLDTAGAIRPLRAASSARHLAFAWIWGALAILLVYGFILNWREWLTFAIGMMAIAGICYGTAIMFSKDAEAGKIDDTMLGLGRKLNMAQVAGMAIAMVGLAVDGKVAVGLMASRSDWAANLSFFSGAMAIAAIGLAALRFDQSPASSGSSAPNGTSSSGPA
jgi:hypothetical protein